PACHLLCRSAYRDPTLRPGGWGGEHAVILTSHRCPPYKPQGPLKHREGRERPLQKPLPGVDGTTTSGPLADAASSARGASGTPQRLRLAGAARARHLPWGLHACRAPGDGLRPSGVSTAPASLALCPVTSPVSLHHPISCSPGQTPEYPPRGR